MVCFRLFGHVSMVQITVTSPRVTSADSVAAYIGSSTHGENYIWVPSFSGVTKVGVTRGGNKFSHKKIYFNQVDGVTRCGPPAPPNDATAKLL